MELECKVWSNAVRTTRNPHELERSVFPTIQIFLSARFVNKNIIFILLASVNFPEFQGIQSRLFKIDKMVKMPNNEAESEDSGPEVNSSESDSEMSGDSSESSEMTENELRIGRKISDYNEILSKSMMSHLRKMRSIIFLFLFSGSREAIYNIAWGALQRANQVININILIQNLCNKPICAF